MSSILLFDFVFRFSGITMLILLIILTSRDMKGTSNSKYLLLASSSLLCLFLGLIPDDIKLPIYLHLIVRFLDIPHLVFIWFFALSLFDSEFKLRRSYWIPALVYCILIATVRLSQFGFIPEVSDWLYIIVSILSIGIVAHILIHTLAGRAEDLNEKRRISRIHLVVVIAFITTLSAIAEITLVSEKEYLLHTVKIAIIWPAVFWAILWLFEIPPIKTTFDHKAGVARSMKPHQHELMKKLTAAIEKDRIYLRNDLSLNALAKELHCTPYKLRILINQYLNFDNFSAFINSYRLNAAKNILSDPEKSDLSILNIALESGFNSLSPFNKAFKAIENISPSEYRKRQTLD